MSLLRSPYRVLCSGLWLALAIGCVLVAPTNSNAQTSTSVTAADGSGAASVLAAEEQDAVQGSEDAAAPSDTEAAATLSLQKDVFAVAVGEPFVLLLDLTGAPSATLMAVRATEEPHLRLTTLSTVVQPDGTQLIEVEGVFYRPGSFRIPSLNAVMLDASGTQTRIESGPLAIEVASSIMNEPDAEPTGSPRPFAVLTTDYLPLIFGSALLLLLAGVVIGVIVAAAAAAARVGDGPRRVVCLAALDAAR
jgi:hypothetical protein